MVVFEVVFWLSIAGVFHAYFGYPLSLFLFRSRQAALVREPIIPAVSLIITVFNEEKRIVEKMENTLELEYPAEKLQVIVASDGSTDKTNEIVESYKSRGVELIEVVNRGGKENAQKEAIPHARGEILVFSDVATILEPRGIHEIVSNFADPNVGCVSSEDRLIGQDGKPSGEGFYVRYEMWLRRLESRVNSLVGLSGSFFAARSEVCQDFSGEVQSDFRTLLSSVRRGMRGVSDPNAVGYYLDIADEKSEFGRKVRTVLRGLTVLFQNLEFFNLGKFGFFSYQLFSHKLMRWLVPYFLVLAFFCNVFLAGTWGFYSLGLAFQVLFYGVAILGWKTTSLKGLLKIPMFFSIVNVAIAVAWWQFITGKRVVFWTPSER